MSETVKKRAMCRITNHLMRELLMLPDNVKVEGAIESDSDRAMDQFTIILTGDGLPDQCRLPDPEMGAWMPYCVRPLYSRIADTNFRTRFDGFKV